MKLITKTIEKQLIAAKQGSDTIVAKYFTPWGGATWYITEGQRAENGDLALFGWCDLGMGCPELGYVMLSDLTGIKGPWGMKVERDLHFSGSLKQVMEWARA